MVEAVPGMPYGDDVTALLTVEPNMSTRRARLSAGLPPGVYPLTLPCFPLLGIGASTAVAPCTTKTSTMNPVPFSQSDYICDSLISPHPRFGALTANIRQRRGGRVDASTPLFIDKKTEVAHVGVLSPALMARFVSADSWTSQIPKETAATRFVFDAQTHHHAAAATSAAATAAATSAAATAAATSATASAPAILMDAMAFGMGCCCLQVTFQAASLRESRLLYDTLAVLSPLFLALTANTVVWRGHLSAGDVRWDVISGAVDCRTEAEREVEGVAVESRGIAGAAGGGVMPLKKSRYSSISCYLGQGEGGDAETKDDKSEDSGVSGHCSEAECDNASTDLLNDIPCEVDALVVGELTRAGVDARLARHVAHLFVRDPLVVFAGRTHEVDDTLSLEHFESLQSTNWCSMRWKPPPLGGEIGWRVELRTMEVQFTDFENAAFAVTALLLSRAILTMRPAILIPLSLVDENFKRAGVSGAAGSGALFWTAAERGGGKGGVGVGPREASLDEIFNGKPTTIAAAATTSVESPTRGRGCGRGVGRGLGRGQGLLGLCADYLDALSPPPPAAARAQIDAYLGFVADRASGAAPTGAAWQRTFITKHRDYRSDSIVGPRIAADLCRAVAGFANGTRDPTELFGAKTMARRAGLGGASGESPSTRLRGASLILH